jgi:SAM-dependent methyltransferase
MNARRPRYTRTVSTAADPIRRAINGAYAYCDEQQSALDRGLLTEEQWFDNHKRHFTSLYLAADNPRAQSGHSGDAARYRYSQEMILDAVDCDGSFLDVGCANGHLMETLDAWSRERGRSLRFFGLDISEELIELARRRIPHWKDRFFVGNALYWRPEMKYRYVCVKELDYVPRDRRKELFLRLRNDFVEDGGRLILGPWAERITDPGIGAEIVQWGYSASGSCRKPHQDRAELERRLYWYDIKGGST